MQPIKIETPQQWNEIIERLPGAHILQSWQWGQIKSQYGWEMQPYTWLDEQNQVFAAALVLKRQLAQKGLGARFQVLYIPKGPVLDWTNPEHVTLVLDDLQSFTEQSSAIFLKIDPDLPLGYGEPGTAEAYEDLNGQKIRDEMIGRGWQFSDDQIQFRNTVLLDLTQPEEALLAAMKQKTRYNIRLAERKGVSLRTGQLADLPALYEMYAKTALRDGFTIRSQDYYQTLWQTFIEAGMAEPIIAEFEGKPIAAVFIFHFAGVSRYLYGMSLEEQRDKMPNYLLQWEAIRRSKALGCHTYDMWGAPDKFDENDALFGVYRFKKGFNGLLLRTIGAWDYTTQPGFYKLYTKILPRLLDIMRWRGKAATKRSVMS